MTITVRTATQPELITCGTYYVAQDDDGVIIGAGGWTAAAPGGGATTRGVGHIRHVAMDDSAIRRGVGRALVEHIVAQIKAQGLRRLQCLSTLNAVPFYAAIGFARDKEITIPLGAGIEFPAVGMIRAL